MPAVGRAVQFRGVNNVVEAYENMGVPQWGLFQSSQFLQQYAGDSVDEGGKLLEQVLSAFDLRSADTVTYTLVVYGDAVPGKTITNKDKYTGSFNFRLTDTIDEYNRTRSIGSTQYEQRIAGLEQQIAELRNPAIIEDAEPELSPMMQMLMRIVEHPQVQQKIAGLAAQLMDKVTDGIGSAFSFKQPVAKVAGIETETQTVMNSEQEKFETAIKILSEIDPNLGTNLLKLAQVAKADPAKYKGMISMLNML